MLFRGSNAVGYSNYPDNVVAGFVKHAARIGHGYLPHLRFAELPAEPEGRDGSGATKRTRICEAAICYTGDILDPEAHEIFAEILREAGEGAGADGRAHPGDQGHGRACAGRTRRMQLVKALQGGNRHSDPLPHARHERHQCRLHPARERRGRGHRRSRDRFDERSHQPAESELASSPRCRTRRAIPGSISDALNEFSDYWEHVRAFYTPFDTAPRSRQRRSLSARNARRAIHQLKEQAASMGLAHRWPEIARTYAEVNQLFGDIVKVTPSSKVVGDMTMFLITRGIKPADVVNLEPGTTSFPESVIDMLMGGSVSRWAAGRRSCRQSFSANTSR